MQARVLLAACVGAVLPRGVAAQPAAGTPAETASLGWTRMTNADECITPRALAQAVEKTLRRSVFVSAARADVTVEGRVERRRTGGWRVMLRATQADGSVAGERTLESSEKSCRALDADLVLVISLMIDPDASLGPSPPSPPSSSPPPPVAPVPLPSPPRPWQVEAGAGIALFAGLTPSVAPALHATLGVRAPGGWSIAVSGATSARAGEATMVDRPMLDFAFAGLLGCPVSHTWDRLDVDACLGLDVGAYRENVSALLPTGSAGHHELLLDGSLRGRGAVHLWGPLFVRGEVGGLVAFSRPRYGYRRLDPELLGFVDVETYRVPLVGGFAGAALVGRF